MEKEKSNILRIDPDPSDDLSIHQIIVKVYDALAEKGYNPINQLVGYILSEDPTYIANYKNARGLIRRVDRDALLNELFKSYLGLE